MSTKVLVFESDPAFAGELRDELGRLGCNTTVVDDGNAGLAQATSDRPDLILLSIELPRMNGFSVCNKLKKDPSLKDVPLIIMSSESSNETFEQHKKLRTRAEDYVHKPIAFGELLQHIQTFVELAPPSSSTVDAAIVIDDEIEIGSTDYVIEADVDPDGMSPAHAHALLERGQYLSEIAAQPPPSSSSAVGGSTMGAEPIDTDVDAFAESAFGRLTGPDASLAPALGSAPAVPDSRPPSRDSRSMLAEPMPGARESRPPSRDSRPAPHDSRPAPPRNGASEAVAPGFPPRILTAPLPVRSPTRPPSTVDIADYDRLREELNRTRARTTELEGELRETRAEIDRLRLDVGESERLSNEVDELRAKLASSAKAGGISSRDFLDLREALNRKDKEILALKEQLARKDREAMELQDKQLAFERTKADVEERLLALERELAETKEANETLGADRDLAKKAADDARSRFERTRADLESKDRQFAELRGRHADELAARDTKLGALRAELDQVLANERAEHARAADQAEQRRRADLDQARRDREAAMAEAREEAQREQQEAIAATRREVEERLADAQKHEEAALEALRAEHIEKIREVENDRDARIAQIQSSTSRELGEIRERSYQLEADLSTARGELGALRETKAREDASTTERLAELERRLSEAQNARDDFGMRLASASERVATLESELATASQDLGDTKQKLAVEASRADKAQSKWQGDRLSLERAKDALAVALAQIEEAEGRPID